MDGACQTASHNLLSPPGGVLWVQGMNRMHLFLLAIFGVYGAAHVYAFLKIKAALVLGLKTGIGLGVFLAVMTAAPLLIRILEQRQWEFPARVLAQIGYGWMGFLFLFICLNLALDGYGLSLQGIRGLFHTDISAWAVSPRAAFLVAGGLALVFCLYGYTEALRIRPERITIHTAKLPASLGRLRIVQISDVHLGLIVRAGRLRRILHVVQAARPDILVATGDLVDGQANSLEGLAELWQAVRPPHGKYAVTGNHEFYAGLDHALPFLNRAGFTVLRGEAVTLDGLVTIAGVDDPAGKAFGLYRRVAETELLGRLPRTTFTVLLRHLPLIRPGTLGLFDLQLSGHTHQGQIFPFALVTRLFFPYNAGWFRLSQGAHLYVSRGTGTWGPPIRFLAPPQITVIDIVPDS